MNTPEKQDVWSLLHDLIFSIPAPVLAALEYVTTLLVVAGLAGAVVRIWKGDSFEIGPLKIERPEIVRNLEIALAALSKDDRLKANVLWMFRERLNQAGQIISDESAQDAVQWWCSDVLTDIVAALSRGGHDRHRASLWIDSGAHLRMYSGTGFRQEAIDNATLPFESIAGTVIQTGKAYNAVNVSGDELFALKPRSGRPYKSLLAVPVKTPLGTTIAALCIDAEAQGYFDADDEFFAGCFADLIALLVGQVITGDER